MDNVLLLTHTIRRHPQGNLDVFALLVEPAENA